MAAHHRGHEQAALGLRSGAPTRLMMSALGTAQAQEPAAGHPLMGREPSRPRPARLPAPSGLEAPSAHVYYPRKGRLLEGTYRSAAPTPCSAASRLVCYSCFRALARDRDEPGYRRHQWLRSRDRHDRRAARERVPLCCTQLFGRSTNHHRKRKELEVYGAFGLLASFDVPPSGEGGWWDVFSLSGAGWQKLDDHQGVM